MLEAAIRDKYQPVIGLEVHIQLASDSKLFAIEDFAFGSEPNTHLSPITFAHPGALPSLNKRCIEFAVKLGLAVGAEINTHTYFDRKNYFYPDLPKGYQMSQDREPICKGGNLRIRTAKGDYHTIKIHHLHLEEDAGKSVHDQSPQESFIDLNRAGVGLIELVTEPDLRSPEEAAAFMAEIRRLVRYLGVGDGDMEKGNLRCDANVSVMLKDAKEYGTRAEIKNMNSMSYLEKAVVYEIQRQIKLIESGGTVIQETRTWDVENERSLSLRDKESADDYRYFPEPDLLPVQIKQEEIDAIAQEIPELPLVRFDRYHKEYGISENEAWSLVEQRADSDYFEALHRATTDPRLAANWFMGPIRSYLNEQQLEITDFPLRPAQLLDLIKLMQEGKVNRQAATGPLFKAFVADPEANVLRIAEKLNLIINNDSGELEKYMEEIMTQHPKEVSLYRGGKKKLMGFFVGQMMRKLQGKGDPKAVNQIVREKLDNWDN
ncbi:MAG: Asp-tRNA(Asn)/Glu-tRNA(Gln) amidotransferase subunit GatB [Bacteroidota bacterium]